MNIGSTLITDAQAPEAMEPAQRAFDHPAPAAQMLLAFDAPPGNARHDASLTQPLAVAAIVVALVGVQLVRALSGPARQARDFGQRLHQGLQQTRVMNVGRRQLRRQRQAALIDDDVMLATELVPVCRIGAGVIPAEGGKERWPSRCWRVPIRVDRAGVTYAAPPRAVAARLLRFANHAGASNRSSRSRNPSPWAGTPRGCRYAGRTGFRSAQPGRSTWGGHPWATAYGPAAAAQWPSKAHRKESA
jgi:hypothetical protein